MRKTVAMLLVLIFLTASCLAVKPVMSSTDVTEDTWVSKASMQVARSGLGVAVVNGKIYAIGGRAENGVLNTNEEYDPATDTWTYKKPMLTPREIFGIAVYQNKIYCIGGYLNNGSVTGINEVYDPAKDTWETKENMPTPRQRLEASVVYGKIYLTGGYVPDTSSFGYSISNLHEVYDPTTNSWDTKTPMPTAAVDYVSAVVDGKLFVIGGQSKAPHSNLNQMYDPISDTWTTGAPSPSGIRYGACAAGATTGVNSTKRIYVLGQTWNLWEGEPPNSVRVYDPQSDVWTFGADVPSEQYGFGVAVVNDILYVIGGYTATPREFPETWMYPPEVTRYATNEQYTPFGYGTPDPSYDGTPPEIAVASPANKTYYTPEAGLNSTNIALEFTVDEPVFSMNYVLDGGIPVEISGNTTLEELAVGLHYITVFGFDSSGNMGTSETLYFTIEKPEPFPTTLVVASVITVAVISISLLVYFKKRKH